MTNLVGDREVEWGWVARRTPAAGNWGGDALDVGPGGSADVSKLLLRLGWRVTAVDLRPSPAAQVKGVTFVLGDARGLPAFPLFDVIVLCSVLEHVGLSGRYGVAADEPDGDLSMMANLRSRLRGKRSRMIVTVPVGRDAVFPAMHRVYGEKRLPDLLRGLDVHLDAFWRKRADNSLWETVSKADALAVEPRVWGADGKHCSYALGGFLLGT